MELQGKTALVTGGGIRLGRAFALALAREGVNLAVHYNRSSEPAQETVNLAQSFGVNAIAVGADFNNLPDAMGLFPRVLEHFTHVDILINNAAIFLKSSGLETDVETWESQFRINLQVPFFLTQAFAQQLPQDQSGSVLNITDARIIKNKTDHFAYFLTKKSLLDMTRLFAKELAPSITVNALGLGFMLPLAEDEDADLEGHIHNNIPLARTGSPEIATENALHLIRSEFTTGAFFRIDGGQFL